MVSLLDRVCFRCICMRSALFLLCRSMCNGSQSCFVATSSGRNAVAALAFHEVSSVPGVACKRLITAVLC